MKLSTVNCSGNVKLTSESMERQKVFDTDPDMILHRNSEEKTDK